MKRRNPWGNVFLIAAAVGFALVTWVPWPVWPGTPFLRAFFEAALVGALADWFAVTALFRKPLGIPLPHTDLLVRRSDQIVQAVPEFLATFLAPAQIAPLLRATDWVALLLAQVGPEDLDRGFRAATSALQRAPSRRGWELRMVGFAAGLLHRELSERREGLIGPLTTVVKRRAGWKGWFVGEDSVDEAVEGLLDELAAVRDQEEHPLRQNLADALDEAWPRWVDEALPSRWLGATWQRLETEPELRADLNRRIAEAALVVWERSQAAEALTRALGQVLRSTEPRELARRIEDAVHADLQYIRVNGALVGGLAGLGLEALRHLT